MLKVKSTEIHEELKKRFPGEWQKTEITLNINGVPTHGTMYGDDECFCTHKGFYQIFVVEDGEGWAQVYYAYYDITDEDGNELQDLGCVDYYNPESIDDNTHIYAYGEIDYKEE